MPKNHRDKPNVEQESAAPAPKRSEFGREIESARQDADALRERISGSPLEKDELVLEAIEQLQTTLEELQVAEEELRAQNDELLSARAELEAERLRYEDLFEFAPDGYLLTDEHGKILEANRAAASMLGVKRRFLLTKPLISYVAETDHTALTHELNCLSKSDSPNMSKLDLRMRPREGEPFYAAIRIAVSRDSKGNPYNVRWLLRDITERVRAANKINALNAELEERVRARTAELEQANALKDELLERERRARAEAEEANRSKDEFLAMVSHELRTPLNSILGWAQLMRAETSDASQREHAAEVIERSARAQARIINDILDVSRIVTGNLRLDMRPLDLAAVIGAALEAARPAIDAKGIQLNVLLGGSTPPVIGDSTRLQQVAANMLSNSIKFTPPGGNIEIKLERAGDAARLIVSDSGQGISSDFLPYVFDRFRQAESMTTRRQSGLGLGLAIVQVLVSMHGGTVHAASDGEGKGSTFTVDLPLANDYAAPAQQSSSPESASMSADPEKLEGLWIVVVDDDSDAREMMRSVLAASGARVTTCGSCGEALAIFFEKSTASLTAPRPDVLVADIAMPGEDGFDLIRAIRKLELQRGGTIPAIALTAYAGDEARRQALSAGYQTHLTKPLHLEELVGAIATLAGTIPTSQS